MLRCLAAVAAVAGLVPFAPSLADAQPAAPSPPVAAPSTTTGWHDVPALIAAATAPVDAALIACFDGHVPQTLALIATRGDGDRTTVGFPFPNVGIRGFTDEERCLFDVVPRIALPPLPAGIDRLMVAHVVAAAGTPAPAVAADFTAWRDPAAALATAITPAQRAALAACDARPRTVRVVVDLRKRATRAWLPAWQFHSARRDGSTPPAQKKIKACLTRAVRSWQLPTLPRAMPELHLALRVAP